MGRFGSTKTIDVPGLEHSVVTLPWGVLRGAFHERLNLFRRTSENRLRGDRDKGDGKQTGDKNARHGAVPL